jgi:putative polyhydroxyalkanoate system protein
VADIHIHRAHKLGLVQARKVAYRWAEQAEKNLQMECTYEESSTRDEVSFTRSGASGTLEVTHEKFELKARLGFLLGAFKGRIESEIVKNLDELLAEPAPAAAKKAVAKIPARKPAKKG